jgi:dTMP kinase
LSAELVEQRERSARAEGEAAARRDALVRETRRLEQAEAARQLQQRLEQFRHMAARREAELTQAQAQQAKALEQAVMGRQAAKVARDAAQAELAAQREQVVRAVGEAAARREGEARAATRAERAEAAREAAWVELAEWTAGGPIARAWRALIYRRGRP